MKKTGSQEYKQVSGQQGASRKKRERVGSMSMKLFTVGYAQKSAKELFDILKRNGVRKVIDIRLKNANSYYFYTHKRDFAFLLNLANIA